MGLDVVVRDSNGKTLMVLENTKPFIGSVEIIEAITIYKAIFKAIEIGISRLWVETDSHILWKLLNSYHLMKIRFSI